MGIYRELQLCAILRACLWLANKIQSRTHAYVCLPRYLADWVTARHISVEAPMMTLSNKQYRGWDKFKWHRVQLLPRPRIKTCARQLRTKSKAMGSNDTCIRFNLICAAQSLLECPLENTTN